MPSDSGDGTEANQSEKNADEDAAAGDDDIGDDEDDEEVLEVDSPVHSPIAVQRRSPTPSTIPNSIDNERSDDEEEEDEGELRATEKLRNEREFENGEPPRKIPRLEEKTIDEIESPIAITQCHHNGGQNYTMRPQLEYNQSSEFSANASKLAESYSATLHVRRDLHYSSTPNFLGSIPFRKRSSGFNREHLHGAHIPFETSNQKISPLNLSNHPAPHNGSSSVYSAPEASSERSAKSDRHSSHLPTVAQPSVASPGLNQMPSIIPQALPPPPVQQPAPAPPRRTGFSIEDIMRR